ncbi:MAG: hypothetical protein JST54_06360 [Deltaproteobacteria bacterium]|nr:hypothetical protein [Deltaproteobacteria bacterium]
MFDSMLQAHAEARPRALGGTVSLALHGAILAAIAWAGLHGPPTPPAPPLPIIRIPIGPKLDFKVPVAAPPAPAPAAHAKAATHKRVVIPPKPVAPPPEATPQPTPASTVDDAPTGAASDSNTQGDGSPGPGSPDGREGGAPMSGGDDGPVLLGPGMTRPQLVGERPEFHFTSAQLQAHAEGLALAQCTISREGALLDCKLVKRIPAIEDAQILEYLSQLHYSPAMQGDQPISIRSFTIPLRLSAP